MKIEIANFIISSFRSSSANKIEEKENIKYISLDVEYSNNVKGQKRSRVGEERRNYKDKRT